MKNILLTCAGGPAAIGVIKSLRDIDLIIEEDNNYNKDEILNNVLDEYNKIFYDSFNITINKKDVVIIDGTTNKKISFHIIFNNNTFFYNSSQQKEYIKYIHSKNIVLKNEIQLNKIIDSSVYNKNKNFRLANQAKLKNNKHTFKIISNHNFKDSLIIDYFSKSQDNILNCEKLQQEKTNIKKCSSNNYNNKCCSKNDINSNFKINDVIYIDETKQELNILLSFIDSNYFEKYDTWYKIGIAIKNINYDFYDLFDFFSTGHKNYNEEQNKYIYNNSNGSYSWDFLFSLSSNEKISEWVKIN